jgi:ABC-type multidrug transport system ATPase subunit
VQFLTEAWVSLQRIQALLELDEVDSVEADRQLQLLAGGNKGETKEAKLGGAGYKAVPVATSEACEIELSAVSTDNAVVGLSENAEFAIVCKNMSGSWAPDADEGAPLVLSDLSYNVRHGELVVIVGQVGCAKTSLLMTVLQELTPSCGSVSVHCRPDDKAAGSIGYCSQEPWIMSSTIRSNILFGRDMDQKWYDEVVHACSLAQDFEMLSHGDLTVIGDRGVNLSGGQRARVGLARAVYGKSTLNLLDDPLSAVDPKVSSQLFHNAICGTMDGLTRVLVTHQTQYLSSSHVSRVMILNEGKIVAFDSYKALQDSGALSQWIDVLETQRRRRASSAVSTDSVEAAVVPAGVDATDSVAPDSVHVGVPEDAAAVVPSAGPEKPAGIIGEKVVGITAQEDRAEGSVGWGAYKDYCSFIGSTFMLVVLLVMLLLGQVSCCDYARNVSFCFISSRLCFVLFVCSTVDVCRRLYLHGSVEQDGQGEAVERPECERLYHPSGGVGGGRSGAHLHVVPCAHGGLSAHARCYAGLGAARADSVLRLQSSGPHSKPLLQGHRVHRQLNA